MKKYLNLFIFSIFTLKISSIFSGFFVENLNSKIESNLDFKIVDSDLGVYNSSAVIETSSETSILYMSGKNSSGQLGNGNSDFDMWSTPLPVDIDGDGTYGNEKIIDVNLGFQHSSAILDNEDGTNSLYMWGNNSSGQLGDGTYRDKYIATPIDVDGDGTEGNEKILYFSTFENHSSAVLDNGDGTTTLYMWGSNELGQLDDNLYEDMSIPIPIDIDGNGTEGNEKIVSVDLGEKYSGVVLDNGNGTNSLYTWGDNTYGQLGNGTTTSKKQVIDINGDEIVGNEKIVDISFGFGHSSVLLDNGDETQSLYLWGLNFFGEVGIYGPESKKFLFPTLLDVDGDGTKGNEKIIDFFLGGYSSSAILDNGNGTTSLYRWGRNDDGQLGFGITDYVGAPLKVDFGIFFDFKVINKNQSSFELEIFTNLDIDEYGKNEISLFDLSNNSYDLEYDSSLSGCYNILPFIPPPPSPLPFLLF